MKALIDFRLHKKKDLMRSEPGGKHGSRSHVSDLDEEGMMASFITRKRSLRKTA